MQYFSIWLSGELEGMKVDCTKPQSFSFIFSVCHGKNHVCLFPKELGEKVAKLYLPTVRRSMSPLVGMRSRRVEPFIAP